jgi:hypothetical protein
MKSFLFIIASAFLLISCDMPQCKNTNPVFEKYSPESEPYKAELAKRLFAMNAEFWIAGYKEMNHEEYICLYTQSDNLCAVAVMRIGNSKNLEQFKRNKGFGYTGAKIAGIKYMTLNEGIKTEFILSDCEIID